MSDREQEVGGERVSERWQEWSPLTPLLEQLPHHFQRGLNTSHLHLTCLAALPKHLLLGTNVGLVYLAHLPSLNLMRLKCENPVEGISCVAGVQTVEDMVAVGGENGTITIFQLPRGDVTAAARSMAASNNNGIGSGVGIPGLNLGLGSGGGGVGSLLTQPSAPQHSHPPVKRFTVTTTHSARITALSWSMNGLILFSGDQNGAVGIVEVDPTRCECTARPLHTEPSPIAQLSYLHQRLGISTHERAVVYSTADSTLVQVGVKPRKHSGAFGCVWSTHAPKKTGLLFTSRPGLRLWAAQGDGQVLNTHIVRDLPVSAEATLLNPSCEAMRDSDYFSFGLLHSLGPHTLVSHTKHWLVAFHTQDRRILTYSGRFREITGVAVSDNEIFVLEGHRTVVCLSQHPPDYIGSAKMPRSPSLSLFELGQLGNKIVSQGTGIMDHIARVGSTVAAKVSEHASPPVRTGQKGGAGRGGMGAMGVWVAEEKEEERGGGGRRTDERGKVWASENLAPSSGSSYSPSSSSSSSSSSSPHISTPTPNSSTAATACNSNNSSYNNMLNIGVIEVVEGVEEAGGDGGGGGGGFDSLENVGPLVMRERTKRKRTRKNASTPTPDTPSDTSPAHTPLVGPPSAPASLDINTNIQEKEVLLADILDMDCLKLDHPTPPQDSDTPPGPLSHMSNPPDTLPWTSESEMSDTQCSTPSTVKEASPAPSSMTGEDFYGRIYDRHLSFSSTDSADAFPSHAVQEHSPGEVSGHGGHFFGHPGRYNIKETSSSYVLEPGKDVYMYIPSRNVKETNPGSISTAGHGFYTHPSKQNNPASIPTTRDGFYTHMSKENHPASIPGATSDFYIRLYDQHESFGSTESTKEASSHVTHNDEDQEEDEDIERLPSNFSEDRSSCLSYGPPSGSSLPSHTTPQLPHTHMHPSLPSQTPQGHVVTLNDSSEVADITWSYQHEDESETESENEEMEERLCGGWTRRTLPGSALSLTASRACRAFVNEAGHLYLAGAKVDDPYRKVTLTRPARQVSLAPSGGIGWVIVEGGEGYAFVPPARPTHPHPPTKMAAVAKNVSQGSVGEERTWFLDVDMQVCVCPSISEDTCALPVPGGGGPGGEVVQVVARGQVVWAITKEGLLLCRIGINNSANNNNNNNSNTGVEWGVMAPPEAPAMGQPMSPVVGLALGAGGAGWVVDARGRLFFRAGVCPAHPQGDSLRWWQVETSEYMVGEELQVGGVLLSASEEGVFLAEVGAQTCCTHVPPITGHRWEVFSDDVWSLVCAEGLYTTQGALCCLSPLGQLFLVNPNTSSIVPLEPPPPPPDSTSSDDSCVVVGMSQRPEVLWVVTGDGRVFIRAGLSASSLIGTHWDELDLTQIGDIQLCHISCGTEVVWGVDTKGGVYMRQGPLTPCHTQALPPAWIQVEPALGTHVEFTKVFVGARLHLVWALDSCLRVYVRQAIYPELPVGLSWVLVPGLAATHLSISEDTVVALTPRGEVFRRTGVTANNFIGDAWERIPGRLAGLSVSTDNTIWGLNACGHLCRHEMMEVTCSSTSTTDITDLTSTTERLHTISLSSETEDWEMV